MFQHPSTPLQPSPSKMTSSITHPSLHDTLAFNLPSGLKLRYYHVSSPPTPCDPIYAAPPGRKPERTHSEPHSLLVTTATIRDGLAAEVAVYAIELILYTTNHISTLFVSKADSTGYASLLGHERGAGSIIRTITTVFISWLIQHRQCAGKRLVLSLFARAQDQYLFPGSVENGAKHVLDDRQLVKWWCKTLDPIVRAHPLDPTATVTSTSTSTPAPNLSSSTPDLSTDSAATQLHTKAHLLVPGHDPHETSFFLPSTSRLDPSGHEYWSAATHPLLRISPYRNAPPRCLIPHFPDDPKARFLAELDEEIPDALLQQHNNNNSSSQGQGQSARGSRVGKAGIKSSMNISATLTSPEKRGTGEWKSVKTLSQFWEMMAFRQECCAGRLVGFIWVVFTPSSLLGEEDAANAVASQHALADSAKASTKRKATASNPGQPSKKRKKHSHLTGPIHTRAPHIKSPTTSFASSQPTSSFASFQPTSSFASTTSTISSSQAGDREGRGVLQLSANSYERTHDLLLRLDFFSLERSGESTRTWVRQVGIVGGRPADEMGGEGSGWGVDVVGTKPQSSSTLPNSNDINANTTGKEERTSGGAAGNVNAGVTILQPNKKSPPAQPATAQANEGEVVSGKVNVIPPMLVRKKAKVEDQKEAS